MILQCTADTHQAAVVDEHNVISIACKSYSFQRSVCLRSFPQPNALTRDNASPTLCITLQRRDSLFHTAVLTKLFRSAPTTDVHVICAEQKKQVVSRTTSGTGEQAVSSTLYFKK